MNKVWRRVSVRTRPLRLLSSHLHVIEILTYN
jgi:hypothetical protein